MKLSSRSAPRWLVFAAILTGCGAAAAGAVWWRQEQSPAAVVRRLERVLDAASSGIQLSYKTGFTAATRGDYFRAVDELARAYHAAPDVVLIQYQLGVAYDGLGREGEALRMYQQVIAEEPRFAPGWMSAGLLLLQLNRPAAARYALARALDLDPSLLPTRLGLGHALIQLGRVGEGERVLQDAVRRQPKAPSAWAALGDALAEQPSPEAQQQASQAYEQSLALFRSNPYVYTRLGQVQLRLGKLREAARSLEEGGRLDPNDPAPAYLLGVVKQVQREPDADAAILRADRLQRTAHRVAQLQARIIDSPRDAPAYLALARLEAARKDYAVAVRYYRVTVQLDPENQQARQELSRCEGRLMLGAPQ